MKRSLLYSLLLVAALSELGSYWYLSIQKNQAPQLFQVTPQDIVAVTSHDKIESFLRCTSWICYHYQLGWWRHPNVVTDIGYGSLTTDETGSRGASSKGNPSLIETYGGSATQGILVKDAGTYQAKLQYNTNLSIRNYGVMGYGPDQSLLFLEQNIARGNQPSLVMLEVTSESLNAMAGTFRMYQTYPEPFYNEVTLPFKPTFELVNEQWVVKGIPTFEQYSDEHLTYALWESGLRDEHLEVRQSTFTFPYTFSALRHFAFYGSWATLIKPAERGRIADRLIYTLRRFVEDSKKVGFIPVVILLPLDKEEASSTEETILRRIFALSPKELVTIDIPKELKKQSSAPMLDDAFAQYEKKSFPTENGNALIASVIRKKLCTTVAVQEKVALYKHLCSRRDPPATEQGENTK